MKINAVNSNFNVQKNYTISSSKNNDNIQVRQDRQLPYTYPAIYFTFTGKKITDMNEGKNKLLKQLDEILKEDTPKKEINQTELQYKCLKIMDSYRRRLEALYDEGDALVQDKTLNMQQKYNHAKQIQKEVNRIKKICDRGYLYVVSINEYVADEKTDYVLINKFKSSVAEDNFNLKKVFQDYYSPMQNIHSLKELKRKYPKIQIPPKPEDIIANKLENTITRDFYEKLENALNKNDEKNFKELLSSKILSLLEENVKIKSPEEKELACKRLIFPMVHAIKSRYYKLHASGSFSSVPEFRKQNKNLLSENDLQLLSINYEDFVLNVLKEQYLNMKNPNEIVYSKNGKTIKVSSLKEPDYKFEKIPSRIIKLMQDAQKVRTSQRDYKNYTPEHFRKKLEFYSEKFDESEQLLNTIIQFDSCLFGEDDVKMLIKFLQGADKVWDGEKTIRELEEDVYFNAIRPVHTDRINEIEQQKKLNEIKAENKRIAKLHNIQKNYDTYIDVLYHNDLNYIAEICSKYRPETLDAQKVETANLIADILDKNINGQKIKNKTKLESQIMRISTYLDYLASDNNSELIKNAQEYSRSKEGAIDIEKAGKYLLNAEFINNYPQSLDIALNKEIAERVAQTSDKQNAIEYLCKYEEYHDLEANDKTKISNILKIFDVKDSTEKFIVKNIIEKEYINVETSKIAKMTEEGNKQTKATIGKNAKKQIYDYYKFPKCLDFYEAFENALGLFAPNKKSSGIKKVISTDANELKIAGFPDRLFAYKNSYYFDEFSPTGLH